MDIRCPNCGATTRSIQRLLTHILQYHDGHMNTITCNIANCQRTFNNVSTWKSHIYRMRCHRAALDIARPYPVNPVNPENPERHHDNQNPDPHDFNGDDSDGDDALNGREQEANMNQNIPKDLYEQFCSRFQKTFFDFALKIREQHMLPVSTTNSIIDDVQGLLEAYQLNIYDIIKQQIAADASEDSMDYIFSDEDLFLSMCQSAKSEGAIANTLYQNYPYTPPIEIKLGETNGKSDIIHVVPLKKCLTNILSHDNILSHIKSHIEKKRNCGNSDKIHDLSYTLSPRNTGVIDIPLIFYLDEFEPCNPIGSRRKTHKLSAIYYISQIAYEFFYGILSYTIYHIPYTIYYTIGSLPINLRTLNKSGFLYGLSYHNLVKQYRYEKIMQQLMDELHDLHTNSLQLELKNGEKVTLNVYLHLFAADNLSAHDIFGMQTNFNFGKFSRYCLADYDNINMLSDFTMCTLRNREDYIKHLEQVEADPAKARRELGLVGKCVFHDLPDIDVTQLFPNDLLHDHAEGVLPVVIMCCIARHNLQHRSDATDSQQFAFDIQI